LVPGAERKTLSGERRGRTVDAPARRGTAPARQRPAPLDKTGRVFSFGKAYPVFEACTFRLHFEFEHDRIPFADFSTGEVTSLPNIKSAMKRVRVSEKQNLRNRMIRSEMKTAIRKFSEAVSSGSENAEALMAEAVSMVDRAASKGTIHKNCANRKKAQIARKMNAAT
jgi:small subunit ribosomal protein S20